MTTGRRLRKNEYGRYYVTDECNGCGVCAQCAELNFEQAFDGTYYYVVQQPYDDAEEAAVQAAIRACPMHAIRSDGEES